MNRVERNPPNTCPTNIKCKCLKAPEKCDAGGCHQQMPALMMDTLLPNSRRQARSCVQVTDDICWSSGSMYHKVQRVFLEMTSESTYEHHSWFMARVGSFWYFLNSEIDLQNPIFHHVRYCCSTAQHKSKFHSKCDDHFDTCTLPWKVEHEWGRSPDQQYLSKIPRSLDNPWKGSFVNIVLATDNLTYGSRTFQFQTHRPQQQLVVVVEGKNSEGHTLSGKKEGTTAENHCWRSFWRDFRHPNDIGTRASGCS